MAPPGSRRQNYTGVPDGTALETHCVRDIAAEHTLTNLYLWTALGVIIAILHSTPDQHRFLQGVTRLENCTIDGSSTINQRRRRTHDSCEWHKQPWAYLGGGGTNKIKFVNVACGNTTSQYWRISNSTAMEGCKWHNCWLKLGHSTARYHDMTARSFKKKAVRLLQ